MIEAWVNSKGELRFFHAVPPEVDRSAPAQPVDPQTISRAIGFDISSGRRPRPGLRPRYAFDWQKAWKGQHPALHTDLTVQAAAWHGKITDLQVLGALVEAVAANRRRTSAIGKQSARTLVMKIIYGLVFLFSAFMAARNLRAGRGDRRGAWRLSVAYFILSALPGLCSAHWVVGHVDDRDPRHECRRMVHARLP